MTYAEAPDFAEKRKYISDLVEMLEPLGRDMSQWRALEIGGEGGILAGLMASHVGHVICTDIISTPAAYDGDALPLLKIKFGRNDEQLPLHKVEFLQADAQDLAFRDNWFDFCYSQNAFEHIPDPELALRELVRVTRSGGIIYLMFDPIWTADSGSHFLQYIGEPWGHLIESDDDIATRMANAGATAEEVDSYLNHMNRRTLAYYREMFARVIAELELKAHIWHEWSACLDASYALHPNLALAAKALDMPQKDLYVRGLRFLLEV